MVEAVFAECSRSLEPLRSVLVLAPVRVSGHPDGEPTAMIFNEVNTGDKDGAVVGMPHVTIEVPADRILEEKSIGTQGPTNFKFK